MEEKERNTEFAIKFCIPASVQWVYSHRIVIWILVMLAINAKFWSFYCKTWYS